MPRLDARFPGFEGIEGAPGLPPPVDARSWVAIAVGNTLRIDEGAESRKTSVSRILLTRMDLNCLRSCIGAI